MAVTFLFTIFVTLVALSAILCGQELVPSWLWSGGGEPVASPPQQEAPGSAALVWGKDGAAPTV